MASGDPFQMRKAALRRLVLARRWIVAASVALTGVLAAIAANAFPGKQINTAASAVRSERAAGEASASGSSAESSSSGLTPPAQAPQSGETQEPAQESTPSEQSEGQAAPETPVISGGS